MKLKNISETVNKDELFKKVSQKKKKISSDFIGHVVMCMRLIYPSSLNYPYHVVMHLLAL